MVGAFRQMVKLYLIIIVLLPLFFGCSNSDTVNSDNPTSEPVDFTNIKMPQVVSSEKLEYPFIARIAGIEGNMAIRIHIDKEGKVIGHKIVNRKFQSSYIPFSKLGIKLFQAKFDSLARKYVERMVFTPAIKDNIPIDIWVRQPISWELYEE